MLIVCLVALPIFFLFIDILAKKKLGGDIHFAGSDVGLGGALLLCTTVLHMVLGNKFATGLDAGTNVVASFFSVGFWVAAIFLAADRTRKWFFVSSVALGFAVFGSSTLLINYYVERGWIQI